MSAGLLKVAAAAEALVGYPWRHQGRDRTGLDCVGFAALAHKACGFDVVEQTGYGRSGDADTLLECLEASMERVRGPIAPGVVGRVALKAFGEPRHLFVMLGDGRIAHAVPPEGVRISFGRAWITRAVDFWAHPDALREVR